MLDIALLIVLFALGFRAFVGLRKESTVRKEFGYIRSLDWLTFLYPLGPIMLLVGQAFIPRLFLLVFVAIFYSCALFMASRQRNLLECSGTDRVRNALAATSSASLGALVGLVYVALAAIFALLVQGIRSPALGA